MMTTIVMGRDVHRASSWRWWGCCSWRAAGSCRRARCDRHQRRRAKPIEDAGRRHAARHAGRQKHLHPVGVRRQGHLRRLQGQGARGRRRLLPTERSHVSRGEEREGVRLTCQVKVKRTCGSRCRRGLRRQEVGVHGPLERQRRHVHQGTVLELPKGETVPFRAGGYIQIECPPHVVKYKDFDIGDEYRGDWDKFNMWRYVSKVDETVSRAYSMANYPEKRHHHAQRPDRVAAAARRPRASRPARCRPTSSTSSRATRSRSRALRRVLRQGDRQRDDVHRRRRRHGADALAHLRPVPSG
jgi:hypothetical protein